MADEVIVWIDPDGASTTLDVEWDVEGRGTPPIEFIEDEIPGQAGGRLREARHGIRELTLPIWLTEPSETALRTTLRDLEFAMDPTRGDGKIRVTGPGGDQRELVCRYAEGLELDERLGSTAGPLAQKAVLVLRAWDPYWQAIADTVEGPFTISTAATFFPFFPLRLSSSEVFADITVDNDGDVLTWPVWTITGPGSSIIVRNLTTGKFTSVTDPDVTLTAGEAVTIDTRPGRKAVTKQDGTSLFPNLTEDSSLWLLQRGPNSVRLEMGGATAASSVQLAHRPLYLGA